MRATILALLLLAGPAVAGPVAETLSVQGTLLTSSGVPASGTYDLTFRLFTAASGGAPVFQQTVGGVAVQGGVFDAELGPLPAGLAAAQGALWLETAVGADTLPRRPLRPAPWALAANEAHLARDLACSGCVGAAEVGFPWALSDTAGGAALDLDCAGCVSAAELEAGSVATTHLQTGGVTADKAGFTYAGSPTKGGPAADLQCSGCVSGAEIVAGAALAGDVTVTGSLTACTAGVAGCSLRVGAPGLADQAGWLAVQSSAGLRVRDATGASWRPVEAGAVTSYGGVTVASGDLKVSAGAVGIGVAPSGAALDVASPGLPARFRSTADAASVSVARFAAGDRATPQPGDSGHLAFLADDAGQDAQERARLTWVQTSPTEGQEAGGLRFHGTRAGALTELQRLEFGADQRGQVVVNPEQKDVTTRVAAAGVEAALVVDGQTARVGVGTASPQARLHVAGDLQVDGQVLARLKNADGPPLACDPAHAGMLYFDAGTSTFRGCDGSSWKELGGSSAPPAPRTVSGFTGTLGPDLSGEGLTQCYGWKNDGAAAGATYAEIRTACGSGVSVTFAGYRAGSGTLVRHDMRLGRPLIHLLPSSFPSSRYWQVIDADNKYSWWLGSPWLLLVKYGNGWSDPGRLWEVHAAGGATAADGHVLSQDGNNAHDQHLVTGDTYFIYIKLNESFAVVDGFSGFYGPDLSGEGLVQCYGWYNDGATAGASYAEIRARCGAGTRVVFAGHRAGSTSLIRHEALLAQPFVNWLPPTFPNYGDSGFYWSSFDSANNYSWYMGNPWLLLVKKNNGWSDPGRLWEPHAGGGIGADAGHVLSATGNNGLDQASVIGDKYYIYIE